MKIIINNNQLHLLTTQFYIVEGQGLVHNGKDVIAESRMKEYLVKVIINGWYAQIRIGAHNGANALMIVRQLFPKVKVMGSYLSA